MPNNYFRLTIQMHSDVIKRRFAMLFAAGDLVMRRLMAVPEGAYRERNLLQGPLDRD
jgi:hypothetical protein